MKFADLEDDFSAPNAFADDSPSAGMYPSQDFEKQSNVIIRPSKMDDYNDDDPPF